MSIADQSCAQAVQKSKKHTKVKETIKRCRRKNLCTAFSYPIKQSKTRKERQRFCGGRT